MLPASGAPELRMKRTISCTLVASMVLAAGLCLTPGAIAQDKTTVPAKQPAATKVLAVGDPAPKLQVEKFIKGKEVTEFKKGHIYVVEFWATWCGPCIRGIPHLTEVQQSHKDKVTVIGVNIWERGYDSDTINKVKALVDKQGDKMNYTVAYDGKAAVTNNAYMKAAGRDSIPCAFVVDGEGRVAYIGHPGEPEMEKTIDALSTGTFDMKAAKEKHKTAAEGERMERANQGKVLELGQKAQSLMEEGKTDEAFAILDEIVAISPNFKPRAEMSKFGYLLMKQHEYDRAFKLGNQLVDGVLKDDAESLNGIAWGIVDTEGLEKRDLNLAMKAATRANELTKSKNPAILDTLARVYWERGDKAKAVELQEKAVANAGAEMKEDLQKALDKYKAGAK